MSVNGVQEKDNTSLQLNDDTGLQPVAPSTGRTLLPGPFAALVSGATGVASLGIKIGTKVGGWGLYGAKEGTLTGLELARWTLETILGNAGRDVSLRSNTEAGKLEADSVLERAVSSLHSTISSISFWTSTGFYLSDVGLHSISALSVQGLATLNAVLGSTESSRAVAAIITLIKDELNKKGSNSEDESVGYSELFLSTCGFVLLQRWGRRKTELDFREAGGEETIWDTVIDDKGFRADVVGTRRDFYHPQANGTRTEIPATFLSPAEDQDIEVLERGTLHDTGSLQLSSDDQTRLSDQEIRDRIIGQLPEGARAVITSETITAKTIKVDIYGSETTHIEAPPGTVMIAERLNRAAGQEHLETDGFPDQTVIFRTALKRSSSAEVEPLDRLHLTANNETPAETADEDVVMMRSSPVFVRDDNYPTASPQTLENSDTEMTEAVPVQSVSPGPVANQKKSRIPTTRIPSDLKSTTSKIPQAKKEKVPSARKSDKTGTFRKALKSLSPSQSSSAVMDLTSPAVRENKRGQGNSTYVSVVPRMTPTLAKDNSLKPLPQTPTSRSYVSLANQGRRSPSAARSTPVQTSFTVHERRRDSTVSQTDTWSVHSSRPGSPTFTRTHATYTTNGLSKTKSERDLIVWDNSVDDHAAIEDDRHHRRSRSFAASLYSMGTKGSEDAIILAPKTPVPRKSVFEDHQILASLATDGMVPGIFPKQHLVRTVRRFARFASASYGSNFLRVMGLTSPDDFGTSTELMTLDVHHEHSSFSTHTGLPHETILLSSFVDPQGMTGNPEWSPSTISPLIHFISIDAEAKAIVLTCRGTLGFEDVLTDMTCDFDDIYWQGQAYRVHKGIHASARRLLGGSGSRVMATIKATMEEYPEFGLVLCGHSLGGAVAAVLAILISEPSEDQTAGASFVTSRAPKLLMNSAHDPTSFYVPPISLPVGRAIHVYAYGTPATVSPELRLATRGLITTVVNHNDVFPSLSLGMLHDFRAVSLHLRADKNEWVTKLKARIWQRMRDAVQSAFYVDSGPPPPENMAGDGLGEDEWAWRNLSNLRKEMKHEKLVPPGEVFVVETSRVFDRQTFTPAAGGNAAGDTATERVFRSLGRPATRVQFKYISDVEGRFGEIRFGRSMFSDHSPGRYEANLAALERGIFDD